MLSNIIIVMCNDRKQLEICQFAKIRQLDDRSDWPRASSWGRTCHRCFDASQRFDLIGGLWQFTVPSYAVRKKKRPSSRIKFHKWSTCTRSKGGKRDRELSSIFWRLPSSPTMMKWMLRVPMELSSDFSTFRMKVNKYNRALPLGLHFLVFIRREKIAVG